MTQVLTGNVLLQLLYQVYKANKRSIPFWISPSVAVAASSGISSVFCWRLYSCCR